MTLDQAPAPDHEAAGGAGSWRARLGALRSDDLRRVWAAQVVSQLGDGMFTIGIVLLMVELTGSGLALSGTLMAQLLPFAVLGAAAGALADRWDRRRTMVLSDIARGVVVSVIPVLHLFGLLHAWTVPVVAFLLTSAGLFFDPARSALVPAITPPRDLVRVNALLSGTRQVLFIAGPAIGGAIVAAGGTMAVFWADGISFFASAAVLVGMHTSGHMPRPEEPAEDDGRSGKLWDDIRVGFRYVWTVPVLRMILIFGTIVNFLLSPLPVIIPLFFTQTLGLGPARFGTALSIIFTGFFVGVTYVGVRGERLRVGWLVIVMMAIAGVAAGLFGLGPPLPVIFLLGFLGGIAIGAMEVAESTMLQRESTDELRGRVFALYESVSQGGRAISVVLAGALSERIGLHVMFYVVGILTVTCALALAADPSVRRVR